jgi:hypothetical protein
MEGKETADELKGKISIIKSASTKLTTTGEDVVTTFMS